MQHRVSKNVPEFSERKEQCKDSDKLKRGNFPEIRIFHSLFKLCVYTCFWWLSPRY